MSHNLHALKAVHTRRQVGWFGAVALETCMPLPGDDLVRQPAFKTTHAVTVQASAELVWSWLVQIGQGRAGFYSDSPWWDSIVDTYYRMLSRGQAQPRVRYQRRDWELTSAWQNLRVGDEIADGPPGTAHYVVKRVDPRRVLVLFSDTHLPYALPARLRTRVAGELTVAYVLVPLRDGKTRIIRRMRMTCRPRWFRFLMVPIVCVWGEWITARNLLRGLKRRAERSHLSKQLEYSRSEQP